MPVMGCCIALRTRLPPCSARRRCLPQCSSSQWNCHLGTWQNPGALVIINEWVSWNGGTPKSSILIMLIGFSIINHSFVGTPNYGNLPNMVLLVLTAGEPHGGIARKREVRVKLEWVDFSRDAHWIPLVYLKTGMIHLSLYNVICRPIDKGHEV